jgi:hypothetical protein
MLDHLFSTLVWLKRPLSAPGLPAKRIVADCYAALNPSNELWKRYLQEIDRLQKHGDITEQDYYLLRYSASAKNALVNLTFGDPQVFSQGTVDEILGRAKAAARADLEVALDAERVRRAEAERVATKTAASVEADRRAQRQHFVSLGTRVGKWCSRGALFVIEVLLALGIYLTLPKPFPPLRGHWLEIITPGLILAFALFTLSSLSSGTTVNSLVRKFEIQVSRVVEHTLVKVASPSEKECPDDR